MSELIGKMIGGFRILAEIKSGGQGQVFKAVCEKPPFDGIEPGTVVAIKVMAVHDEGEPVLEKLEKVTGELVRLSHPNVVKYYGCFREIGLACGLYVVVQELLEGETLKQRLARNPHGLDADEVLRIVDATLAGLECTAASGIVHRNVKPGNIFLCSDGGVKLIDFEDAYQMGDTTTPELGNLVGSFDYIAPDFMNSTFHGDERSDIFSMGVVMHETISGRMPYLRTGGKSGRADFAFLSRWDRLHEDGTNPIKISPRANRLLAHSGEVLAKALAPLPQDRYQTFAEFHEGFKTISYHEIKGGGSTYRFLQQIRGDDFCEVFKSRILDTGRLVVVKSFSEGKDGSRLRHEAMIFRKLMKLLEPNDASYFIEYLDYFAISDEIDAAELPWDCLKAFLVMAYLPDMPGSTLLDAIRAANGALLPRRETFIAFARYAHALAILHKHGIVHRDIKPSNLYFPKGHPENAVLIGFTIACDVARTQSAEGVVGTLAYMPPESILTNNCGDSRRDIYALGLSLYEALTGKTAYPRLPLKHAVITFVTRAKNKELPSFDSPVVVSRPKLLQLLKDMTNLDPEKRIRDAAEVERRLAELVSDVKEQDLSGVLCLDDTPPSTNNDNATKNSEMKPDEVPTDDAATLNPASDTETGGCRVEAPLTSWKIAADGFQCRRVIGRGGQSVVFEAVCTKPVLDGINVGAKVALKVLNGYGSDDDLRKFNELIKRLPSSVVRHYGCIRVCRGNDSATAIVMDLLQGETLRSRLCRRPHGLDVDEAVGIMKSLVITLSSLHSLGVIHRDIKPGNVFIGHDGCVTLLDFTSAKWNGDAIEPMAGRGIGTPKYRAPEMKSPDFTGDEKSDIYSASLVLREMLCGKTDDEAGSKSKSRRSGLFRHVKQTVNDRIADVGKLSSDLLRIIKRGLSIRYWRYGTCNKLLADLEKIRFPIYEYDNHRYMRLSYERCSGCVANGVAYGKMLDIGTGQVFKWKTFKMDVVKPRKYDEYAFWCPYSLGETRLGSWSWLAKVKDNCLRLDLEAAFPMRDGKERLMLLVYSLGMDAPENTLRYQGNALCAKSLGERQRDAICLTKRLCVSDALTAFARYARGVSILHEAGIETVDVAPDILLYEDGHPSSSAITCRRYDCQCVLHRGHAGPGSLPVPQECWPSDWWQSECCLTFFYRLPNGDMCDAFALGLCLYEAITGRKGYGAPLLDKYGHIIHRGKLSIDLDDQILVKHPDVADVIRQMTEIDKRRRLRDMRKIEDVLRLLAVKYRLVGSEIRTSLKCEGLPNKAAECASVGLNGCNADARMSSLIPYGFGGNYTKDVDYMSNVLVALRKVTSRKYIVPRMIRNIAEGPFMGIPESKDLDEYRECSPRNHCDCSVPEVFYEGDPDVT